jgi:predicted nucleotide-binding protein (sugar kinase/HSP70/actin superfamily)
MEAVLSGKYDLSKTAILISQTGGGCRASNYIGFIRRALEKAGYPDIPVISINLSGLEKNPGFKYTPEMLFKGIYALVFGDLFMRVLYHTRPYEIVPGEANRVHKELSERCKNFLMQKHPSQKGFKRLCNEIVTEFDRIPVSDEVKPKVGVVGEILVKFSPSANNELVELLESEGAEAVVPDLMDFLLYCFKNTEFKAQYLGKKKMSAKVGRLGIKALEWFRAPANKALAKSIHFSPASNIDHMADMASEIVSLGNQTGEGWFLTAEMLELIENGTPNIVCTQPFACLPNHIVGKGVIKELRRRHPESNIVAIDYDPGASEVNQLNRIKLMLSTAFKNIEKQKEA